MESGLLRRSTRYSQESNYGEEEDEEEEEDDDDDEEEQDSFTRAASEKLIEKIEEKKGYLERLKQELKSLKKEPFVIPDESEEEKEARILNRIQQLKKSSLWFTFEPKKRMDPSLKKPKVHWDFVLEEMSWLSSIFQQEMKAKKLGAKKCAKMVQKHFSDKALSVARAEKAHEQHLKKLASFQAKEIREFWSNVEKFFEFRLQKRIEYMRKKALDEHLNFIVDKTEKFSNMLAESLAQDISSPSLKNEQQSKMIQESESAPEKYEKEYRPDSSSEDDEETIAMDEKDHGQDEEELNKLKKESEIPIEELLRKYYSDQQASNSESEEKDKVMEVEKNDESEQVVKKEKSKEVVSKMEEKDVEEVDNNYSKSDIISSPKDETSHDKKKENKVEEEEEEREYTLERLMNEEESDSDFNNVIAMAAKFQPTGNTLATTNVKTPIPFILKHSLREYQHIGLDWLVTLQERKLNGILADEMGLGKTIQTIAFLAHMACEKQLWGPHLIVVPTSVLLNWEMEIKKWAPSFKVLTYYGSQKERRLKRIGWTKPNAFHICITSYKLVIQDHSSFRRKKWHYFILDEAQHIKNFKSQRWQMLLNFASDGRLLLTGTPLQNNLMELWSLMHFLMPHVFESHRDFKEWFSNPLTGMVEGSAEYNDGLIKRLHKVLRPFLLRRLKNEVEKQLPKKYEHIIRCGLSNRQRYLYDDFMSRTKTKETLETNKETENLYSMMISCHEPRLKRHLRLGTFLV
uniref:Helicase ATP-binding domain-containing protein n=1 Tax=Lepeophtheirus salmonis TaxID=72036 RepID=A0A0K2UA14_LEPSM